MSPLQNIERLVRAKLNALATLTVPQGLADRFSQYRDDPVGFVREQLGARPEPYQAEVLEAFAGSPRVAWRAAHGTGKTAVLAWALLWWLLTRPFSKVIVLAPAFERQIGRYLLPEARKWARNAPEALPVVIRANTVEVEGHGREWFAVGVQASDSTKVEGGHAESICILADEAKGLDAEVVAALHGTQTDLGGDRLYVLASVPGGPSGPFYDVFREGSKLWELFHTSAEQSAIVSPAWIEERREEWGDSSPLYIARVLGEFPEEDEGTLFKLSDLEAAVGRDLGYQADRSVRLGVDVARFGGDASAIAAWEGKRLLGVTLRRGLDTMAVASWVAGEINRQQASRVFVDEIGIGSGVLDRLHQLGHSHRVQGVNVGAAARRPKLFRNLRAELFWDFRTALEKSELSLPDDPQLISELSSFRYVYDAAGKIQLESKDETKKRVGHSPDRADAAVLGCPAKRRRERVPRLSRSYVAV